MPWVSTWSRGTKDRSVRSSKTSKAGRRFSCFVFLVTAKVVNENFFMELTVWGSESEGRALPQQREEDGTVGAHNLLESPEQLIARAASQIVTPGSDSAWARNPNDRAGPDLIPCGQESQIMCSIRQ